MNILHYIWRPQRKSRLTPKTTKARVVRNAIIQSSQWFSELTHSSSEASIYHLLHLDFMPITYDSSFRHIFFYELLNKQLHQRRFLNVNLSVCRAKGHKPHSYYFVVMVFYLSKLLIICYVLVLEKHNTFK